MSTILHRVFPTVAIVVAGLAGSQAQMIAPGGQPVLTDVVVFTTDSVGNWTGPNTWETRPGGNFNIWIQDAAPGGLFVNGPTDASARPNLALSVGNSSYRIFGEPGAIFSRIGISLFFDSSETPSISAYGPMLTAEGPHIFSADGAPMTPRTIPGPQFGTTVPGAGTLSFASGDFVVTLIDFYLATPSVYNLDAVGPMSVGPSGVADFVGGFSFSVVQIPEPQFGLWGIGLLAVAYRRVRGKR